MVEKDTFDMHPKLLHDTISRQAGTLEKAMLEGCMNGREAGSKTISIGYRQKPFDEVPKDGLSNFIVTIDDDGKGFKDRSEVNRFFKTFGTPHDENENKIWAEFRMGRGQLFSFGKNTWRTSTFRMTVDFKHWGLTYELEDNLPKIKGCHIEIELYEPLIGYHYSSIEQFKERVTRQIKYMDGKIKFEDKQINIPVTTIKWDYEDDDAYYMFNCGTELEVYNIGAFVRGYSSYDQGMEGVIVSKQMLLVNFARNDIQYNCARWQRIQKVIRANVKKKTRKARRSLTDPERIATLRFLRDGEEQLSAIKMLALIPTSQGKRVSLDVIRKNTNFWTVAPHGDRYADKMMQRGKALCIDERILTQLGYTGPIKFFFKWLILDSIPDDIRDPEKFGGYEVHNWKKDKLIKAWQSVPNLYREYENLKQDVSEDYTYIADKDFTVSERRILKVLNGYDTWKGRSIMLGLSDIATAWTDGSTYICIDKEWLNDCYFGFHSQTNELFAILSHELTHNEDTRGSHIHGPEFYEAFHELILSVDAPTQHIADFYETMKRSKIEERKAKEKVDKRKKKAKLDEKMGVKVAASYKP